MAQKKEGCLGGGGTGVCTYFAFCKDLRPSMVMVVRSPSSPHTSVAPIIELAYPATLVFDEMWNKTKSSALS